jgi:hypothetical protein
MTEETGSYNTALTKISGMLPVQTSTGVFIDNGFDLYQELLAIQSSRGRVTFHPVAANPTGGFIVRSSPDSVTYDASNG